MKVRSTFAVAAIAVAAWAVPAMATPPSAVYYDRSPRHEDPWSDRQDQRTVFQHGQQQRGGRAPAKEADNDSDEKETIKQLARQVKELTRQVKELNDKLEEGETPRGGKPATGRPMQGRQEGREERPEQTGPEQKGWGQLGRGPGRFGRMGPMGGGPGGRGMSGGMTGGQGRPGLGGKDGEGNRFFGPTTRQPAKAEQTESTKPARNAERDDDDQPAHKMVTIRAKKIDDGDGEVEEKLLVITGDKMPKLPDGLKIEPGDKIIIIRAKGDNDADEKVSVKAKKQIKEDEETDDDKPAKKEQARPRGHRGE